MGIDKNSTPTTLSAFFMAFSLKIAYRAYLSLLKRGRTGNGTRFNELLLLDSFPRGSWLEFSGSGTRLAFS